MSEQVLIATLGSEPQVVTLALDLLRARGYSIRAVKVVHTTGESLQAGLKILAEEFSGSAMTRAKACPQPGRRAQRTPSEEGLSSRAWRAWREKFYRDMDYHAVSIEEEDGQLETSRA